MTKRNNCLALCEILIIVFCLNLFLAGCNNTKQSVIIWKLPLKRKHKTLMKSNGICQTEFSRIWKLLMRNE